MFNIYFVERNPQKKNVARGTPVGVGWDEEKIPWNTQ